MSEMDWEKLLNKKRLKDNTDTTKQEDARSEFQRDYDRILFSSPFRRLQDKTQVFPIPKSDFVHNRLTHSIEVASVGRSLGLLAGKWLIEEKKAIDEKKFTKQDIADVIAAACLAHDIGNPPFGHSGEKAISSYFKSKHFDNSTIKGDAGYYDLINFEGNAAGFRILTNEHPSGLPGGLRLTYAALGSFTKYPWQSTALNEEKKLWEKDYVKNGKYGFFKSEIEIYKEIAEQLGLIDKSEDGVLIYARHPLSFLMEAADTICYRVIDIEDAHKLKILTYEESKTLLLKIVKNNEEKSDYTDTKFESIEKCDKGEAIGYLRAKAINSLIYEAIEVFKVEYPKIMKGEQNTELMDICKSKDHLNSIANILKDKAFVNTAVLQIELAGYEVMSGLIDLFINAYKNPKDNKSKKLKSLLPSQFKNGNEFESNEYIQLLKISEFVSRMTDSYAIDFFKKLKGISLPDIG